MPDVANDYKKSEVSINTQFKKRKKVRKKEKKKVRKGFYGSYNGSGLKGFIDHDELQVP